MEISSYGIRIAEPKRVALLDIIYKKLGIQDLKTHEGFVGSHPISLTSETSRHLLQKDYFVCEKSDGIRALMLIFTNEDGTPCTFLYDRRNDFYKCPILVPRLGVTLLDGEIIEEENVEASFAIFDCLIFNGKNITQEVYVDRLKKGDQVVKMMKYIIKEKSVNETIVKVLAHVYGSESVDIQRRLSDVNRTFDNNIKRLSNDASNAEMPESNKEYRIGNQAHGETMDKNTNLARLNSMDNGAQCATPEKRQYNQEVMNKKPKIIHKLLKMQVYCKFMVYSFEVKKIWDTIPSLKHANDGLIFTPLKEPYHIGKRTTILKWKPPHLNTVDFLIKKTHMPTVHELYCNLTESTKVVYDYLISEEDLDNKIGEFQYDSEGYFVDVEDDYALKKGGWKLYKIRTDKNSANNIRIVNNVFESIIENIGIEYLEKMCPSIYREYRKRKNESTERSVKATDI